jgi:hypothetical protein
VSYGWLIAEEVAEAHCFRLKDFGGNGTVGAGGGS